MTQEELLAILAEIAAKFDDAGIRQNPGSEMERLRDARAKDETLHVVGDITFDEPLDATVSFQALSGRAKDDYIRAALAVYDIRQITNRYLWPEDGGEK
jgi:hypothetical protein